MISVHHQLKLLWVSSFIASAVVAMPTAPAQASASRSISNESVCSVNDVLVFFQPFSKMIGALYSVPEAFHGLDFTKDITSKWEVFASADHIQSISRPRGAGSLTHYDLFPLIAGFRHVCDWNPRFASYLGVRTTVGFIYTRNQASGFCEDDFRKTLRGSASTGIRWRGNGRMFCDLFIKYDYLELHDSSKNTGIESSRLNLSGVKAGIGLGFCL